MPHDDIVADDNRIVEEEDENEEHSVTELMPEVASNAEFLSDETFTFAETLKANQGTDIFKIAATQENETDGEEQNTEKGRYSESRHS